MLGEEKPRKKVLEGVQKKEDPPSPSSPTLWEKSNQAGRGLLRRIGSFRQSFRKTSSNGKAHVPKVADETSDKVAPSTVERAETPPPNAPSPTPSADTLVDSTNASRSLTPTNFDVTYVPFDASTTVALVNVFATEIPEGFVYENVTNGEYLAIDSAEFCESDDSDAYELPDNLRWKHATIYELLVHNDELLRASNDVGAENLENFMKIGFSFGLVDAILTIIPITQPTQIINTRLECFGIAAFHCLMACPSFREYVKIKKPITEIDFHVRSLVAQYTIGWENLRITSLLTMLGFKRDNQDCSDLFYRQLVDMYFDGDFGNVKCEQECKCAECEGISITRLEKARISLDRKDASFESGTTEAMIKYTARIITVERKCESCGCNESRIKYIYNLPDIISLSLDILYMQNVEHKAILSKRADFGPFENSDKKIKRLLRGTVYYEKYENYEQYEQNEENRILGHYTAQVRYGHKKYLVDDMYPVSKTYKVPNGKPYLAFYTK